LREANALKKIKFSPGFFSGITLIIEGDYIKYLSATKLNEQGSVPIKSMIPLQKGVFFLAFSPFKSLLGLSSI
jgi:hypothetical protein